MSESPEHKETSEHIAALFDATYNPGEGADIITDTVVIEVETAKSASEGVDQLSPYSQKVYIAGTDPEAVANALLATAGTDVGVMDNQGNIIKPSTR